MGPSIRLGTPSSGLEVGFIPPRAILQGLWDEHPPQPLA